MKEKEQIICKCVYCGAEPKIIHYDSDMWYVECSNQECHKHLKYAYLGLRRELAIEQWNYVNRPINRTPPKRKKKNETDDIQPTNARNSNNRFKKTV